jgi:GMP reductase
MRYLTYDDVALVPQYSTITSRKICDTSSYLGTKSFRLPVMPANMQCVIDVHVAKYLSEYNYFYVMHRFNEVTVPFVRTANKENWKTISISTGVNYDSLHELMTLKTENLRIDYITIDVAHGHHEKVKTRIKECKQFFPNAFIIAGNVATVEGFNDLSDWGAAAVKVGIGQGAACTTKLKTGFTMPMFSCIQQIVRNSDRNAVLIADGSIKYNGDIAKALVAGADWVMAGGIFAACSDSPAKETENGKEYFGSASAECKGHTTNVEGKKIIVNTHMSYAEKLQEIKEDLQSAISYSGGNKINQLKYKEIWVQV